MTSEPAHMGTSTEAWVNWAKNEIAALQIRVDMLRLIAQGWQHEDADPIMQACAGTVILVLEGEPGKDFDESEPGFRGGAF
jgi:hypothetical protein